METKKLKFYLLIFWVIISVGVFAFSAFFALDSAYFVGVLQEYKIAEVIYIGWMIIAAATVLPISAVMVAGMIVFSFWTMLAYTYIGVLIGAIGTFYIARWLGEDYALADYKKKYSGKWHLINEEIQKHSIPYSMVFIFFYLFPSNLGYMVAGITRMKLWQMILVTIGGTFTTIFSFALIIFGTMTGDIIYFILGISLLIAVNITPFILHFQHIKKAFLVFFNEKYYKKLCALEKRFKGKMKKTQGIGKELGN